MTQKHIATNRRILCLVVMLWTILMPIYSTEHRVVIDNPEKATGIIQNIQPDSYIEIRVPIYFGENTLKLPDRCVLKFNGGTISAGKIIGNNTTIEAPLTKIISTKSIEGTWAVRVAYPEWFGAKPCLSSGKQLYDCSNAIKISLGLRPSELLFSKGIYGISEPIVVSCSNINISAGAEIRAMKEMNYSTYINGKESSVNSMIVGDYETIDNKEIFGLSTTKLIYGGGCVNADYKASVAIALNRCLRTIVKDLTIKNANKYCFQASLDGKAAGNCFMQNCVFKNEDDWQNDKATVHHEKVVAIYNNKSDCNYTNIEIVNFQTAIRQEGYNGNFTNVHAWLRDAYYWKNSVVFDCFYPDITLTNCEADTMRRLLKCRRNDFFANINNCKSYNNKNVVSDDVASKLHPIIIDKNGVKDTQVRMSGGYYWYDIPYEIISEPSGNDIIKDARLNKAQILK